MRKIRNLFVENRFFLSPMLEPNDIAFRLLCKMAGAALTYTGMVNALSKQKIYFDDVPALQIFGSTPRGIKEFIKKYDDKVSLWDFNLGCPSKLSKKLSHGAFMHKDFENIRAILKVMRSSTNKPVSLKLRKSPQALEIGRIANQYCDLIGIHPRTSEQGYSGLPDYSFALKLKKNSKIPVIYSGDVNLENCNKILKDFDFVFIGRASLGNPGIFSELVGKESSIDFFDYMNLARKYNVPFRNMKYHAMHFTKGVFNGSKTRMEIIKTKDPDSLEEVMGASMKKKLKIEAVKKCLPA